MVLSGLAIANRRLIMIEGLQELYDYYQNAERVSILKNGKTLNETLKLATRTLLNRDMIAVAFYNLKNNEKEIRGFADKFMIDNRTWENVTTNAKYQGYTEGYFMTKLLLSGESDEDKGGNFNKEQLKFRNIVDKILSKTRLSSAEITHINQRTHRELEQWEDMSGDLPLRFHQYKNNEIILLALYDFVIALSRGDTQIGKCEMPGCYKIFIPYKSGREQRYCSASHRVMACQFRKSINA